jgi:hypothetical protein
VALTWYANCKPYFVACNAYYFLFACCGNVSVSMFPQCSPITTFYFFCGKFGNKRRADTKKTNKHSKTRRFIFKASPVPKKLSIGHFFIKKGYKYFAKDYLAKLAKPGVHLSSAIIYI